MTDGTTDGTKLAVDINPGPDGSGPWSLVLSGKQLFFTADDGDHGEELWKVDLVNPVERLDGDANGDRQVNFTDFLVLSKNFGMETLAGAADGDFDEDGRVGFSDFLLLSKEFGRSA